MLTAFLFVPGMIKFCGLLPQLKLLREKIMGRLLSVHACPVCNYHVEDQLHEGGSGIAVMFLNHRYVLAICDDCKNLVSILVRNTEQQTEEALKTARHDIVQMEADAVIGDDRARD